MTHELKCWPAPFDAILKGVKRHEVRQTRDRFFRAGDTVVLHEYDPVTAEYSGRSMAFTIGHVSLPGTFGLPHDLCVFTLLFQNPSLQPS